jgi:thiosulfate dehydrogenase
MHRSSGFGARLIARRAVRAIALFMMLMAGGSAAAFEGPSQDMELGPTFLLSLGGKLYDDVWIVLDQEPPAERNAAAPADAAVSDRATWRCVTCHGWSYSGGAVGGAVYPGLRDLAGADPESIKERIIAPDHPFPAQALPDLGLDLLAFFIRDGLYDRADFIDENGHVVGNPEFGRDIFEGACINCHQLDGRAYLRGEHGDRSSLGWVARRRPEQALHKMINGVPGAEMLSLRFLSLSQIADLFAYLQAIDAAER